MAHAHVPDARQAPGSAESFRDRSTPSFRKRATRIVNDWLSREPEQIDTSSSAIDGKRTADDSNKSQQLRILGKFRRVALVVQATLLFAKPQNPPGFGIGPHRLKSIMRERRMDKVERLGGLTKISEQLQTNLKNGLDDSEEALEKRRTGFGSNKLPSKPVQSFWMILGKAFLKKSSVALILFAISLLVAEMYMTGPKEGWYNGASILIALGIQIHVKAISEYRQYVLLQTISEEKKHFEVEAIRKGRPCEISALDIVVGDIVVVSDGDQLPADGMVVSGQLTVDESWMTGRSVPVDKNSEKPFLLSECKVIDGCGTMLVLAVGVNTEWAYRVTSTLPEVSGDDELLGSTRPEGDGANKPRQISPSTASEVSGEDVSHQVPMSIPPEVHAEDTPHEVGVTTPSEIHGEGTARRAPIPSIVHRKGTPLQARLKTLARRAFTRTVAHEKDTPLQARLRALAKFLMRLGVTVDTLTVFALLIWFFIVDFKDDKSTSTVINEVLYVSIYLVTNLMVTASDALPDAVPLIVAYALRKMRAEKSMIRNLGACEKMGAITTIYSDKTGTLTLDKMTVVKSVMVGKKSVMDGKLQLESLQEGLQGISTRVQTTLFSGFFQNSSGRVFGSDNDQQRAVSGTPTETAMLSWALQIGMKYDEIKRSTSVVHVEAFNSAKVRAGIIVKGTDANMEAHCKGAPELILEKSKKWVDKDGEVHSMSPEMSVDLKNYIEGLAAKSLRCIAFAYRPLTHTEVPDTVEERQTWEIPSDNLTFLCLIGMENRCRPGVRDAVQKCKDARIKVRMVTGDSLSTAKAIAQECGILTVSSVAEGRVLGDPNVKTEDLDKLLPTLEVLAMSSPSNKLRLVQELKKRGEVVALTGDGTKDARALREADVGLAMGIVGGEVTKQSSDIVILDDNFASIMKVVPWGRSVHANIQKFIQFQLALNFTVLVINFVPAVAYRTGPLSPVQLLWVDLVMDTFGALALVTEAPTKDLMDAGPVGRDEPLITNVTWKNVVTQSVYQMAALLTIFHAGESMFNIHGEDYDEREARKNTMVFNAFVMCQIFNMANARRPEKKNLFEGLFQNSTFVIVILTEIVVQFFIVEVLGILCPGFASTKPLTWQQWSSAWPLEP